MTMRSFAVFQDIPVPSDMVPSPASSNPTASTSSLTPTPPSSISTISSLSSIIDSLAKPIASVEKENLHPVTGLPTLPNHSSKKRKSDVLSTKVHNPTMSPISKDIKESKPRKVAPSSMRRTKSASTGIKSKPSKNKERRILGVSSDSLRPSSSGHPLSATRSLRTLGPLPEVPDTTGEADSQLHIDVAATTKALIESRCYDLTVSPLADVSTAYLQSGASQDDKDGGDTDVEDDDSAVNSHPSAERFTMSRSVTGLTRFGTFASYSPAKPSFSRSVSLSALERSFSGTHFSVCMDHDPGFTVFRDGSSVSQSSNDRSKSIVENESGSQDCDNAEENPTNMTTPERRELYAQFTFSSPLRSLKN